MCVTNKNNNIIQTVFVSCTCCHGYPENIFPLLLTYTSRSPQCTAPIGPSGSHAPRLPPRQEMEQSQCHPHTHTHTHTHTHRGTDLMFVVIFNVWDSTAQGLIRGWWEDEVRPPTRWGGLDSRHSTSSLSSFLPFLPSCLKTVWGCVALNTLTTLSTSGGGGWGARVT